MRAGLPQPRPAVHEVQPDEAAERAGGGRRLRKLRQTTGQGAVSRRLSAEELAVQRLVAGTAGGKRRHQYDTTVTSGSERLCFCSCQGVERFSLGLVQRTSGSLLFADESTLFITSYK